MANGLLSENPLDDPRYEYTSALSLAPFRTRKILDIDETSDDGIEIAIPGLLRGPLNAAVRMGQMARGQRAPGLLIGDVMDFSPAGLLGRMPAGALGMNAFHGTPNRFAPEPGFPQGRPRLDKMGTGEGAQQYGKGFYSAEGKGVAESYRAYLSGLDGDLVVGGQTFKVDPSGGKGEVNELLKRIYKEARLQFTDTDGKFRTLGEFSDETVDGALSSMRASNETREWAAKNLKGRDIGFRPSGSLYKLDIPDADAAKLLDYDAPISAQPKVVQDAITKLGFMPDTPDKMAGGDVWFRMRRQLGEQEAADAMREAGVPGLRYKDAGSRGKSDSDGTRNFVVWDQDVLDRTKILQRNDETFEAAPGVPAMGLLNSNNNNRPGGLDFYGMYSGGVI